MTIVYYFYITCPKQLHEKSVISRHRRMHFCPRGGAIYPEIKPKNVFLALGVHPPGYAYARSSQCPYLRLHVACVSQVFVLILKGFILVLVIVGLLPVNITGWA